MPDGTKDQFRKLFVWDGEEGLEIETAKEADDRAGGNDVEADRLAVEDDVLGKVNRAFELLHERLRTNVGV